MDFYYGTTWKMTVHMAAADDVFDGDFFCLFPQGALSKIWD